MTSSSSKKPRLGRQCARHFEPPLVDRGQVARRRRAPWPTSPTKSIASRALCARDVRLLVAQERAGHHVGEHRHAAERSCHLKCARQAVGANVVRPQADEFAAERGDRTGVGPVKAGDEIEARRLAGAVRPDQRDGFAFVDRKAQVLNGAQSAEPLAEVADDERLSHRAGLPSAPGAALQRCAYRRRVSTPISPLGRHRITAIRMRL